MQETLAVLLIVGVFAIPFTSNPYECPDNPEEHLSKMTPAQRRVVLADGILDWQEVSDWSEGKITE